MKLSKLGRFSLYVVDNSEQQKKEQNLHVRCMKCGKLLAKRLSHGHAEIKCTRCGTLNTVLERMIEQVVITDPNGIILFINEAVEQASGFSSTDAIGRRPGDLWGNQMNKSFYQNMWNVITNKKERFSATMTNKKKTGESYDTEMIISPILDTKGNILFFVGIEVVSGR